MGTPTLQPAIRSLPAIRFLPLSQWEEQRPVALVTSGPAWKAVQGWLHLPVAWRVEPRQATLPHWQEMLEGLQGEVVYAVGGGLAADAAKFLAAQRDLPLICVPTALSVDAFFTWASGIREGGCVRYVETRSPDLLVMDLDVIAAAPPSLRAAGICDVLSIATGLWDWRFAEEEGHNPPEMAYAEWVAGVARGILQGALDCAEAAGAGDPDGLLSLVQCLALEVLLCNLVGHSRPEEGSEHYFAYAVENEVGPGRTHAELVGPGILLMAERQGQDVAPLRRALQACRIPLDAIPQEVVERTLERLPEYVARHDLPYGIAHALGTAGAHGTG
jgi:glycerol-1-phosphate dehydrogenase [NAD(P)+]